MHRLKKPLAAVIITAALLSMPSAYALPALEEGDLGLLARLALLEAGSSDEGQQAVIRVVLNRLEDGRWGTTIREVIYAPGQFSTARRLDSVEAGETEYVNVLAVLLEDEPCLPPYVLYFRASRDHAWDGYRHYGVVGGNWFGFMRGDRE